MNILKVLMLFLISRNRKRNALKQDDNKVYHAVFWLNVYSISNQRCDWRVGVLIHYIHMTSFRIKIVCEGKLCGNVKNA